MNRKSLSLAVLFGLTIPYASAASEMAPSNTFQHEGNVTLGTHTDDFGDGLWNLDYRYYFNPVNMENGPYALSEFLAQESNIGTQYAQMGVVTDIVSYQVDGIYVFHSNWFIGASYNRVDLDDDNFYIDSSVDDIVEYGARIGYFFNSASEISFSYQTSSTSDTQSFSSSTENVFSSSNDSDYQLYSIAMHSFIPLASSSGLDLLASWSYVDQDYQSNNTFSLYDDFKSMSKTNQNIVTLSADWYINKAWSVGANYIWSQYDTDSKYITADSYDQYSFDDISNQYSITTAYWWQISQHFAAKFSVAKQFGLDGDNLPDGLLIGISANARF
ncbi:hypothetical protein HWQ46_24285 [Shewanella sp. D64]|uniref:hypothetical protein n=1 Tax=unclassified Shewanella TaxID=196818 RepID=UPI0022BA4B20|nr:MULTISPECIES: hypothetical protein [unclassified Shewanella]MEC4728645.1 hypothetical protein [Shewanella sp. D64]MEC4740592.1 hypothetical protein [Shewanella sp. E94]WBJ95100.1 hypothetical protein HWQ47_25365 [Shewanella sp. MTB7]